MVVAAIIRTIWTGNCCCCCCCGNNGIKIEEEWRRLYDPVKDEERREARHQETDIWLSSTAADLDLISDWWFFIDLYQNSNLESPTSDTSTLFLLIFCLIASVLWLAEVVKLSYVVQSNISDHWPCLPISIVLLEDIPQLVITSILEARQNQTISSLGTFNIMTSVFSILITLATEIFLNCCYGCERVNKKIDGEANNNNNNDDDADNDSNCGEGAVDVDTPRADSLKCGHHKGIHIQRADC